MRLNVPMTVAFDVGTPTLCVPDPDATAKAQRTRLFQLVVVGPLMIWGGAKAGGLGGGALALLGIGAMFRSARDHARASTTAAMVTPAPLPATTSDVDNS